MLYLIILLFIFICAISVFFYNQLKQREDEIEELYDMFYSFLEGINIKNKKDHKKSKVVNFDTRNF